MVKQKKQKANLLITLLAAAVTVFVVITSVVLLRTSSAPTEQNMTGATAISFSWWGNDPRHEYTLKGIDLFEHENPDVIVQPSYGVWNGYEYKNRIAMLSHNESDVMQINYSWMKEYSPDGKGYYDLNRLRGVIDFDQFTSEDLARCSINNKLNGLPTAYNMPAFFYNLDLLDKYGLEMPKSWDDLFEAAKVMSKDGIYPLSVVTKHIWLMCLAWYEQESGVAAFADDGTLMVDEKGFEKILEFYKRLIDEKVIPSQENSGQMFGNQETAGVLAWISDGDRYCDPLTQEGVRCDVGQNLSIGGDSYSGWHMKPASMIAISSITDEPEIAGRLVNFLLNDEDFALLQGTEKGVPVSGAAYDALDKKNAMNVIQKKATGNMMANQKVITLSVPAVENDKIITIFKDESDKYLYDKETIEESAENIVEQIHALGD